MRGKQRRAGATRSRRGITPAHAGKTSLWLRPFCGSGDHPRACGENSKRFAWRGKCQGSPPRMRGKPKRFVVLYFLNGITPAHAGKTLPYPPGKSGQRDHPRACGENFREGRSMCWEEGSPPAHAGKTVRGPVKEFAWRDHPRACGENRALSGRESDTEGSPPRMRGKLVEVLRLAHACGITPAHAGKTVYHRGLGRRRRDHPRACGEN